MRDRGLALGQTTHKPSPFTLTLSLSLSLAATSHLGLGLLSSPPGSHLVSSRLFLFLFLFLFLSLFIVLQLSFSFRVRTSSLDSRFSFLVLVSRFLFLVSRLSSFIDTLDSSLLRPIISPHTIFGLPLALNLHSLHTSTRFTDTLPRYHKN